MFKENSVKEHELSSHGLMLLIAYTIPKNQGKNCFTKNFSSYMLKHDFEYLLHAIGISAYVSEEEAVAVMVEAGFKTKEIYGATYFNANGPFAKKLDQQARKFI